MRFIGNTQQSKQQISGYAAQVEEWPSINAGAYNDDNVVAPGLHHLVAQPYQPIQQPSITYHHNTASQTASASAPMQHSYNSRAGNSANPNSLVSATAYETNTGPAATYSDAATNNVVSPPGTSPVGNQQTYSQSSPSGYQIGNAGGGKSISFGCKNVQIYALHELQAQRALLSNKQSVILLVLLFSQEIPL